MGTEKHLKIYLITIFIMLAGIIYSIANAFIEPNVSDFFISNIIKKSSKQKDIGSKDIVLVVIDESSINQIRWPWPRSYYAKMFDFLENQAGAKVILFDAVVTSPDPYAKLEDEIFYKYIKTANKLILGFDMCKIEKNSEPCKIIQDNLYYEFNKKFDLNIENKRDFYPNSNDYNGIMYMQPEFIKNAKTLGTVIVMDRDTERFGNDRTIRTYSNLVYYNGKYYPSLALIGYSKIADEKDFILNKNSLVSKSGNLKINFPKSAIKSQSNYTYLKWYKPYNKSPYYTHNAYSAIDVLNLANNIENGKEKYIKSNDGGIITPELFKDKIVFIGANANAQSLNDKLGSPVLTNHAGIDIQATALNNYLDNISSQKSDIIINITITGIIIVISLLLIYYLNAAASVTLNFALIFLYFIIYIECLKHDFVLNFITIFFIEILLFAFAYIYRYTKEGEKKDKIQKAMGKYLSDTVMQKVVKDIDKLELGGKKTLASIMFIDIRKFTTISEKMDADEVSLLLNEYFSTIYPIITENNGILNKFIGDAVLTIFEGEQHAKNAIYCANEILKSVKALQQKWLNEGKPQINIGVGINSGEVFIGNIGTKDRMEYTVIGDTVNTASRIEDFNKIYKTKFLIGETTYNLAKSYIDVIKINGVKLRGKSQKIDIYEVIRVNQK